jgi:hydrogenase maturation protein HypF
MPKGTSIHITGIVQGVGFRPWVWRIARELELRGFVRNDFDGVRIEIDGSPEQFLQALDSNPPPLARIDNIEVSAIDCGLFDEFTIQHSENCGEALQRISPDIGICEDCRRELFDPSDRRYRYPFINCVNCGPRFSIIENLPYDRPHTSMSEFEMCDACRAEYSDPASRRFHAQPIACPDCGPELWACSVGSQSQSAHSVDTALWEEVWHDAMAQGKIVAVKGIGGFHLACDALNESAVAALRKRKGREAKPFALMVPDLKWAGEVCELSPCEERLLTAAERPVVVLKLKAGFPTAELIAPGLDTLGVMLPYSPMHEIMFNRFSHPVVMTSANYSSEPMIQSNDEASRRLADIADLFLMHDRRIVNRCDDPVCAVFDGQTMVLRPGRGIAPVSIPIESDRCILACGADMKNTFALAHHRHVTLHPYVGDLEHPDTQTILEDAIEQELDCFRQSPDLIVHDMHPDYFSTGIARSFASRLGVPAIAVQHHHAHLAGVHPGRAIGFAFDGTGYGTDGTIWGGEVLVYDAGAFERAYHLRPFALPGGDAAVTNPSRILDALLYQTEQADQVDPAILQMLAAEVNCPSTSSMGRLFDAVSCLLGVCRKPTYDGEAAIRLEAAADQEECGDLAFAIRDGEMDWRPMIADLLDGVEKGIPVPVLAARFHNTLAEIIYCCGKALAEKYGNLPWVFAGGVFQNRLLVERVKKVAADEFELVFSAYPNDSGIPIGQAIIGARQWALK